MPRIRPLIGIVLSILLIALCFMPQSRILLGLPECHKMVVGESSEILIDLPGQLDDKIQMQVMGSSQSVFASPEDPAITVNKKPLGYEITALKPGKINVKFKLLGILPIKSMAIESVPSRRVVPGGHSIGVLLQSRGIMVVGFAPVLGSNGEKQYPAREEGVEIGDLILEVDNKALSTENELAQIIDEKEGTELLLGIKRKDKFLSIPVEAVFCPETQRHRIGLYVRDGIVGVGTLTLWEPDTGTFAALGHIIIDADTRQNIDVLQGEIVSASIQSIKAGKPGKPGEKIGVFKQNGSISGTIKKNSYFGIYGSTQNDVENPLKQYSMEVAYSHQVKEGPAQIYTVINAEDIETFDVVIEKVYPDRKNGKGMVIRVTDPRLLTVTGGIIQGMSGSPIIQDSKIVGAVTHVFLNDPERGYGVFMDNILSEMPAKKK